MTSSQTNAQRTPQLEATVVLSSVDGIVASRCHLGAFVIRVRFCHDSTCALDCDVDAA